MWTAEDRGDLNSLNLFPWQVSGALACDQLNTMGADDQSHWMLSHPREADRQDKRNKGHNSSEHAPT
jgi:hypothetical protein